MFLSWYIVRQKDVFYLYRLVECGDTRDILKCLQVSHGQIQTVPKFKLFWQSSEQLEKICLRLRNCNFLCLSVLLINAVVCFSKILFLYALLLIYEKGRLLEKLGNTGYSWNDLRFMQIEALLPYSIDFSFTVLKCKYFCELGENVACLITWDEDKKNA
jgi:hypothetical protein